jgi:CRISPR-associated protein Cas2
VARRRFLVAYDIREPKRLRTVHAAMKGFGDPLQYSVFLCDLDATERILMRARLRELINEREDSVAIVDLGEALGRGMDCFEFLGVTLGLPKAGPRIV